MYPVKRTSMANDGAIFGKAFGIRDPEAFAHNLARMLEEAGKAAAAYLKPRENGQSPLDFRDNLTDIVTTLTTVGNIGWLSPSGGSKPRVGSSRPTPASGRRRCSA